MARPVIGSAESVVEHHPESGEIGDTFGGRRFGHAAAGIPVGEIAYPLRKTAENIRVQLGVGSTRGPFGPEEVGGGGNEGNDPVRCDGKKLGKEIVFAAEVCHRRNSAETIVAARTPEAGRQPGPH